MFLCFLRLSLSVVECSQFLGICSLPGEHPNTQDQNCVAEASQGHVLIPLNSGTGKDFCKNHRFSKRSSCFGDCVRKISLLEKTVRLRTVKRKSQNQTEERVYCRNTNSPRDLEPTWWHLKMINMWYWMKVPSLTCYILFKFTVSSQACILQNKTQWLH